MATNLGPGKQPEDVFDDILKDALGRLVATQMPEDAPTENLHFGFGRTPILLFGWGKGVEHPFCNFHREHIIILCTFATIGA